METLPQLFIAQIGATFGDSGRAWLGRLPALIADCAVTWDLTLGPHYPNLSFNYVAPGIRRDGTPIVLKIGCPNHEYRTEVEALRLYAGHGAIRLLDFDEGRVALLLERLTPGTMLATLPNDEEATLIAARLMRQIRRSVPEQHPFPTADDWFIGLRELREKFGGGTGPFPTRAVEEAETLAAELFRTAAAPTVLHGDLHHFNILAGERQPWLAIDPKGLIGEPAYEVGAWMRNWPPDDADPVPLLERRLDLFATEFGVERARLRAWTVAQGVLSAWWSYDDEGYEAERKTLGVRPFAMLEYFARLRE